MALTHVTICFLLFASVAMGQEVCRKGYWGDDCNSACSAGCMGKDNECNKATGACNVASACKKDWENKGGEKNCATPICFGANGCDAGGICIAPNYCICGAAGAQTVGIHGDYSAGAKEMATGTNCVNLRWNGMKGALIALVVLSLSITFCGLVGGKPKKA